MTPIHLAERLLDRAAAYTVDARDAAALGRDDDATVCLTVAIELRKIAREVKGDALELLVNGPAVWR